jgi:hypothetical protein
LDTGNELFRNSDGNIVNEGESVSGDYPVEGITSSGSGNKPSFATAAAVAAVMTNQTKAEFWIRC